jgi:hypothetical protein
MRRSDWLGMNVYDMTSEQEELLEIRGYSIEYPELDYHDDKIIRDIPHYIVPKNKFINVYWNRSMGKFEVALTKVSTILSAKVQAELTECIQIIESLESLKDIQSIIKEEDTDYSQIELRVLSGMSESDIRRCSND